MTESNRERIQAALSRLGEGAPLREGAAALLGALGYRSRRTVEAGGVAEFRELLDSADPARPLTGRQRALFEPWRAVEIVFQITDSEIGGERGLFDAAEGFDSGRAKSFLFVAADLEDGAYTRTHLADTARAVNRGFAMPVVVLFRHGPAVTLAAVHRRAHRKDTDRDVLEKVTLVKDVRAADPHRAHVDVLGDLALPGLIDAGVGDFDGLHAKWEQVLDVEALNRRFYQELFAWFQSASVACSFPDDGAGEGSTERHVIRLVTRLLFIWFLKEKRLVPEELFDESFAHRVLENHESDSTDYYRAVLQNLFFATLNTEIAKRRFSSKSTATHRDFTRYRYRSLLSDPDGFMGLLRSVPFVNGGLFDCLDDFASTSKGGRRIDAFTDNPTHGKDLDVPARLFLDSGDGLFPLFHRYKFTVEENTPLDQEVALDPELLGRVFENLLAAYNPETRQTARKATGSYYTPRRVVDYMVGEALATALAERAAPADGDAGFLRDRLGYLLDWEDACEDAATLFQPDETDSLVRAIAGLKVLDPAVGSGAFPMGVLQTLTLALRRLDPDNALWEAFQKERAKARAGAAFDTGDRDAREEELREINDTFERYRRTDFGRKLYLIQNGVYGVDIQPIACQIAKLRFFISLVIEQDASDDPADNYGIRPLPNLDTRIVAADALIGIGTERQGVLRSDAVRVLEDRLRRVRERHFNARARTDKLALAQEDGELRGALAVELESHGFAHDSAQALAEWDLYNQNSRADWFDPEWMFGVIGGFDIVVGNPPYVESRNNLLSEQAKQAYGNQVTADWNDTLPRGSDLLVYFFARSAKLLHESGVGCFITQNAWLSTDYGLAFQAFSGSRLSFARIVDTSQRFFSDPHGPNINAVISFFGRTNSPCIEYAVADADMDISAVRTIQTRAGVKWGHQFSMPEFFDAMLTSVCESQRPNGPAGIRFGQGINVRRSKLNSPGATLGVVDKDCSFVARQPDAGLNPRDVPRARRDKRPALIMPRGIGDRYYCSFNLCKSFSLSRVDLYLPGDLWESDLHYCLWVYLNSSFAWLFREITGRKNLGGGMLKAEATDMNALPVAFDFDFGNEARTIFRSLGNRTPLPVSQEIETKEHLFIDELVARFFGFTDAQTERIRESLLEQVKLRASRAKPRR